MNGSRSTPHRLGERSSLDALSRTIEGLEARIEGLVNHARDPQLRASEGSVRDAWAGRAPERDPRDARPDPLAEIRERQRMLEESRRRALGAAARPPIPQPPQRTADAAAPLMRDTGRYEAERRPGDIYRPREQRPLQPAAPSANEAALKEIAQALVSLREDLKRDITDGVSREFTALRAEMHDIKAVAGGQRGSSDELLSELARLGESIDLLGHQARAHGGSQELKAEFEDLRSLMDGLARQETVRHMEERWSGMERQIAGIDPNPLRDEIVSMAYRLDDIKAQLGTLNPSPAIHALEDRLLALAEVMEQIGHHIRPNDHLIAEQFAGLDLRLDEISRAIAASARASQSQEPELLQRLERRIAGLGEQIGAIGEENSRRSDPALELIQRIETLSARVEDLAGADAGVEAASRLEERLDQLSRMLEHSQKAPPAPELTGFLSDISRKIDALDTSSFNGKLNERLEYLARRIDEIDIPQAPAPQDDSGFLRLESRLSDIARRLDQTASGPTSDGQALQGLEHQIANLAALINQPSQPHQATIAFPPEIESRMASIEEYMATSDEYVIEAARQAAEAVMEAYGRTAGQPAAVDFTALAALADDLRQLEEIAHGSEERTHRTFEALHETLVQIAGRLDEMDYRLGGGQHAESELPEEHYFDEARAYHAEEAQRELAQAATARLMESELERPMNFAEGGEHFRFSGPVIRTVEPEVQKAVEEAAREFTRAEETDSQAPAVTRGFLTGLTAKFRRKEKAPASQAPRQERAVVDPAPPMVPDDESLHGMETELLEPGSGAPDIKKILERVRANQGRISGAIPTETDRSDLIAAARRAAQAAAQEARAGNLKSLREGTGSQTMAKPEGAGGSMFTRHRRPILMAVGAVLLAIMTMPLVNTFLSGTDAPMPVDVIEPGKAASPAKASAGPAMASTPAAPAMASTPAAPAKAAAKPAAAPLQPQTSAPQPAKTQAAEKPAASAPAKSAPAAAIPAVAAIPAATPTAAAKDSTRLTTVAPVAGAAAPAFSTAPVAAVPAAGLVPSQPPKPGMAVPAGLEPKALADAATAGDPLALFEIGARFTEGRGVASDLATAAQWYQMAADKGFAPAQYRIANLYEKGNGVARDLAKARDYYERAAKAGNASAMHNLAVLYAQGTDGKPETAKAVEWFKQAADLGVSDSQFNLAILYARGNGIAQDLEESYKWFAVAARGGDKDAAQKRDDVANAMRPEQLQNARAKVDLWRVKPLDPKANATEVPDAWAGKALKTASVDMKKAIRNIQAILNNNGFDAGKPDGELGGKTVTAIKAFQKSAGMPADGKITDQLVKELLARNK